MKGHHSLAPSVFEDEDEDEDEKENEDVTAASAKHGTTPPFLAQPWR